MKALLLYLWQLPQNIIGLILIKILKAEKRYYQEKDLIWYFFKHNYLSGVCLGGYILLPYNDEKAIKHEYGHQIQSKRLGWLYLFIIGIPSVIRNLQSRRKRRQGMDSDHISHWYYSGFPEKQADELGGVAR